MPKVKKSRTSSSLRITTKPKKPVTIKKKLRKYRTNNRTGLLKKALKKSKNNRILQEEAQKRINNLVAFEILMSKNNSTNRKTVSKKKISKKNSNVMNNLERRLAALRGP